MIRWELDTCNCKIRFDDVTTEVISTCSLHQSLSSNPSSLKTKLIDHNSRVNFVCSELTTQVSNKFFDNNGSKIKAGTISWQFVNDVLEITILISLSNAEKNKISTAVSSRFGSTVTVVFV